MTHLQEITRWVAEFDPQVMVVPRDRNILTIRRDVTGRRKCRVEEVFLLHRQRPKHYESLQECIRLENQLCLGENAPVFGESSEIVAEKAQLARILPGGQGLYQVTLKVTYTMNLEE